MKTNIKKKIVSELRLSIELDLNQAKNIHFSLIQLLKEHKEDGFLDDLKELSESLSQALDERQLY